MQTTLQKRLAASIFGCSEKRVWFDDEKINEIKESITKQDIRDLIREGAIRQKPVKSISQGRTRLKKIQKAKGHQKGQGSRKGKGGARHPHKKMWMIKIRVQREFIKELRDNETIDNDAFHDLYRKSKGGFFRNKRHLKLYAEEHDLFKKKQK